MREERHSAIIEFFISMETYRTFEKTDIKI